MGGPMAARTAARDDRGMPSTTRNAVRRGVAQGGRDPVNELYDRASDLVMASAELRAVAARLNNDAAVAAMLNCLETALEDAATTIDVLRSGSMRRITGAWPILDNASAVAERVGDQFGEASAAIRAATRECEELRGTVGPLLAGLTAV